MINISRLNRKLKVKNISMNFKRISRAKTFGLVLVNLSTNASCLFNFRVFVGC